MPAQPLDAALRHRPRLAAGASSAEVVTHFQRRFGLDVRHVDERTGRAVEVGARPLTWAQAQRLDQLLRQVPARFVRGNPGLEGLVLVDRNTVGRKGGYRPPVRRVLIYRAGQSLTLPDEDLPASSVFVATVAHELGEAAWEAVLTAAQRERYANTIAPRMDPRASEEFADLFMRGVLAPPQVERVVARAFLRELGVKLQSR